MFDKNTYEQRRHKLRKDVESGLILFLGNGDSPMNYSANIYPFRQDSTFLYFVGVDQPGLATVLDCDENRCILFGNDATVDDIIWMGPQPMLKETAKKVGIKEQLPMANLEEVVHKAMLGGRRIHFLPPYRPANALWLESLTGIQARSVKVHASHELIQAVITQRSIKSAEEIMEIESALEITASMFDEAKKMVRPGPRENEISGKLEGTALKAGRRLAFPPIITIRGETLHNAPTTHHIQKGQLLVIDTGSESLRHYASDITRTLPVSGKFTSKQREIYQTVYEMQQSALEAIQPGVPYRQVHLLAARKLVENLKAIGLMKGNADEAVAAGAHAMFFPHGLGHMLGLDVHDMEDLGEKNVGYDAKMERSDQFGLSYLRLARNLETGFVLTVEPGLYFIPPLIDQWKKEKKHTAFINYARVDAYRGFGGIRIEDNVMITSKGARILGIPIPKEIKEFEA